MSGSSRPRRQLWIGIGIGVAATVAVMGAVIFLMPATESVIGETFEREPTFSLGPDTVGLGPLVALEQEKRYADSSKDSTSQQLYEVGKVSLILSAQMSLARMGFWPGSYSGVLDQGTEKAIREYETARGLPPTGYLFTPATYRRLYADGVRIEQHDRRPSLGLKQFNWERDFVWVQGPLVTEGQPESYERVDITCTLRERQCTLSSARLVSFLSSNTLDLIPTTTTYEIERWDQAEIVTAPSQGPCFREVLRINRVEEIAVIVSSRISNTGPLCQVAHNVPETVSRLVDQAVLDSLNARESFAIFDSLTQMGPKVRAVFDPVWHRGGLK